MHDETHNAPVPKIAPTKPQLVAGATSPIHFYLRYSVFLIESLVRRHRHQHVKTRPKHLRPVMSHIHLSNRLFERHDLVIPHAATPWLDSLDITLHYETTRERSLEKNVCVDRACCGDIGSMFYL